MDLIGDPKVALVLVGNKSDLQSERQVSTQEVNFELRKIKFERESSFILLRFIFVICRSTVSSLKLSKFS